MNKNDNNNTIKKKINFTSHIYYKMQFYIEETHEMTLSPEERPETTRSTEEPSEMILSTESSSEMKLSIGETPETEEPKYSIKKIGDMTYENISEMNYNQLQGDYRTFDSGKMKITSQNDNITEVEVSVFYDGCDNWGTREYIFKIGDNISVLNENFKTIRGTIQSFIRKNDNIIKVLIKIIINEKEYFKIYHVLDCSKLSPEIDLIFQKHGF